ncbi:MAG: hypothetical protein MJK07_15730 [Flavobacteriales bacterium]|nr:hypothetical protein [Flavobacteriales bacterium]
MLKNTVIGKSFADEKIVDLKHKVYAFCDFRNSIFNDLDLSGKRFVCCNFGNVTLSSVKVDKATFDGCFSSVYAKTYIVNCQLENSVIINSHLVIDKGESREFITIWDDDMEELLHDALNVEGLDYPSYDKLDALFEREFDNSLLFGLHLNCAMFVEDGFQRGRMLERLMKTEIYNSPEYSELFKIFIVSFLGDDYHGVRYACVEHLKVLSPDFEIFEYGVNRMFSSVDKDIANGVRQLKELLKLGYINLVTDRIVERLMFLEENYYEDDENDISYQSNFVLDEIEHIRNKIDKGLNKDH